MRKFIIGLLLCTGVNTVSAIKVGDIKHMGEYFSGHYYGLLAKLRDGEKVKRSDLISAYSGDPFLKNKSGASGHVKFEHDYLPISTEVIAHGTSDIESPKELKGHHDWLQIYVNVLQNNFNLTDPTAADIAKFEMIDAEKGWQALIEKEAEVLAERKK